MKTMKFRLLATIITLAAVITATTIPANAQRRSTQENEKSKDVENKHSERKSNVEKKSSFKENAIEPKANNRSVNNSREVNRHNSTAAKEMIREGVREVTRNSENQNKRSTIDSHSKSTSQNRNDDREKNDNRKSNGNFDNNSKTKNDNVITNKSELPRRTTGYSTADGRNNNNRNDENLSYNSNRSSRNNSERYNHYDDDARYKPNRDYRGSDKYWSPEFRGESLSKNHYDKNYKWNNYNHWDRNWETYRWNQNSWRNYYGFYDPYSYRNHKYYYHHHYYGHVIRRFVYRPQIYMHNHTKYYCYDGFFFRYRSGVGYVLVDIPFGFAFDYLPDNYDRVYVNGYLYFRVGNLFFENTGFGFSLVHFPERYFAYNDGYYNGGFRFDDMNF